MDELARLIGYFVMCIGASVVLAGLITLLVWCFNRASWWVMNAYGGIRTFRQFRAWYWSEGPGATTGKEPGND